MEVTINLLEAVVEIRPNHRQELLTLAIDNKHIIAKPAFTIHLEKYVLVADNLGPKSFHILSSE